jgi:hypothetical protein
MVIKNQIGIMQLVITLIKLTGKIQNPDLRETVTNYSTNNSALQPYLKLLALQVFA